MNVLEYLQNGGNVIKNPDYNPKTKKGRLQKPTLTNYKPGDNILDQAISASVGSAAGLGYNLNGIDIDSYSDYGVYVNPRQSQEELDKERAVNQSTFEQGTRMIGQTLNEVVLGTGVAIADLADIMYLGITGDLMNTDYQSDLAKSLEQVKESINERLSIYRENPNEAWDVTDFAWWASNVPSIVSSLTLMVPGTAVTKGLGLIGKGLKNVPSLTKTALKVRNTIAKTEKAQEILSNAGKAVSTGLTMRLLENYQEAGQTYNNVLDFATDKLSNMTDIQRAEFIKNNPKYENMEDDEIAKDIAKNSADVTMSEDWLNSVFDIWQVYSLKNLWKNALGGNTTARLNRVNRQSAAMFGNEGKAISEAIDNAGLLTKAKTFLRESADDIRNGVRAEWTEGIEEGINYIASQDGLYAGKKVFDKNIDAPTLGEYLTDPHLWEQAFWGAIGGVVFSTVSNKVLELYNKKLDKDWKNAESNKEEEIYNRSNTFAEYQNNLSLIANKKNPFLTYKDETGKTVNPDISTEQQEELRQVAEKQYIDSLVLNAMNAGNMNLLEAWAKDSNVNKGFQDKLGINAAEANELQQKLINSIDNTKQTYDKIISQVNKVGGNFEVGKIIATEQVKANNMRVLYNNLLNHAENKINNELNNPTNKIIREEVEKARNGIYEHRLSNIEQSIKNVNADVNMTDTQKRNEISRLENEAETIRNNYVRPEDENIIKDNNRAAKNIQSNNKDLFAALYQSYNAKIQQADNERKLNNSEEYITKEVTRLNNFFNKARVKILNAAEEDLSKMYSKYEVSEVDAVIRGEEVENISKEDKYIIQKAYKALDLGTPGNEFLNNRLDSFRKMATIEKNNIVEEEIEEVDDGTVEEEGNGDVNVDDSPTGGQTQDSLNKSDDSIIGNDNLDKEEGIKIDDSRPPVGEGNDAPQAQINSLPESAIDRQNDIIDRYLDYLTTHNISENDTSAIQDNSQAILNEIVAAGYDTTEAGPIIQELTNNLSLVYSAIVDEATVGVHRNATLAILKQDEKIVKQLLRDFVNSKDASGNNRGKKIGDKYYVSIGQLGAFLKTIAGYETIYNHFFNRLRETLYKITRENGDIIVVDDDILQKINDHVGFDQYVDDLTKRRYERLSEETFNVVNIEEITQEGYDIFTTLKPEDELDTQYDARKGRIYLSKNNVIVGHIGYAPPNKEGVFERTNGNWIYEVRESKSGIIISPLKNVFTEILETNIDINFINELTIFAIEYKDSSKRKGENYINKLTKLYNDFRKLYPEIDKNFIVHSVDGTIKNELQAIQHLANVARFGLQFGGQTGSIDNWFNNVFNGYQQAYNLVNDKTKGTFKVSRINYGVLNNKDGNFNPIESTITNYDESVNAIGFSKTYGTGYLARFSDGSVTPVSQKGGIVYVRVETADGSFINAHGKLGKISEGIGKDGNIVVNGAKSYITNAISRLVDASITDYTFDNFAKDIKALFGFNGIFEGDVKVDRNYTSVIVNVGKEAVLYINSNGNIVFKDPRLAGIAKQSGKQNYVITNNELSNTLVQNILKEIFDNVFNNSTFARNVSLIDDKLRENDDITNKFVTRKNNKTVIDFGNNFNVEYNSYQEFLVKNDIVKVKLSNSHGDMANGNWLYDEDSSYLDVNFNFKAKPITETIEAKTGDVDFNRMNEIVELPDDLNQLEVALTQTPLIEGIESIFADDKIASGYINNLKAIGIFPNNINLVDSIRTEKNIEAQGVYDPKTDTISISRKAIANKTYYETVRIIMHESLHQKFNNVYDKADAYRKVRDLFEDYRKVVEVMEDGEVKNIAKKYLMNHLTNNEKINLSKNAHKQALEEFIIESLTRRELMNILNNIKYDSKVKAKPKNFFVRLLEAIAEIFGIKINEDSMLAAAKDIYSTFKEKGEKVNDVKPKEQHTPESNKQLNLFNDNDFNKVDNAQEESNFNNDDAANFREFSIIENSSVSSIPDLIDSKPSAMQAEFAALLDTGQLSFSCM